MTISPETRRLYQECRKVIYEIEQKGLFFTEHEERLESLCDALRNMTAVALKVNHKLKPIHNFIYGGRLKCLGCNTDWLAFADEKLRDKMEKKPNEPF